MEEPYSSSSDESTNYHSNLNVPSVNLADLRKKDNKIKPKSNLAKARKRIQSGGKSVRFPDSTNYRDSVLSNSSTTNFSSERTDDDSDVGSVAERQNQPGSADLPNFKFQMPMEQRMSSDDELDNSDVPDMAYAVNTYNDDSSDNDTAHSPRNETDITDIKLRRSSLSSKDSGSKRNAFGDIFRKMSLAEHAGVANEDTPSRSDTFLGKVLNFSSGSGLGGGGMVPGVANYRKEESIDEEKEVGGDLNQPIEMKNLDFADLGAEAKNLIHAHAPELRIHEAQQDPFDYDSSRNESTAFLIDNETPAATSGAPNWSGPKEGSSEAFYQPNPDLLKQDLEGDLRDDDYFENDGYVAPPKQVHAGVLSSLLKLYQNSNENKSQSTLTPSFGGGSTLADEQEFDESPHKFSHKPDFSNLKGKMKHGPKKLAGRLHHGKSKLATPEKTFSDDEDEDGELDAEAAKLPSFQNAKPKQPRAAKPDAKKIGKKFKKQNQKLRITVHIADILQRQRFIIRMCRALMLYGAPTHRLEEYMVMTSRVLEIDGQFVYFPGTMIIAFGDAATRTSEVHLVRCAQGLNLSKLSDTHKIYKDVIHDLVGVEQAGAKLEELLKSKNEYSSWICVFLYGLGSASVCTWGFGGGWYDLPISFGVGLIIGYLQFFMSSKSHLYSSVFEVTASIVVSFIARGIGSIQDGKHFCFGAIAQGSLALILPGYIILCGSLELQSKNLVAGSVRMFYAIIYSLFLGFGITLGAALYGWVDSGATDAATCPDGHAIDDKWRIFFVPLFSVCLGLINQARFSQLPVMTIITGISYTGTYFAGKHFSNVTEFTAAIGAFIIGVLGNMYSRIGKGMAVSAMLPAIFVQVPSGIASKSTLLAGVDTANKITNSSSSSSDSTDLSSLSFGATMVEVSIGISVGLFAAAIIVYPFGKRRSGLFTL